MLMLWMRTKEDHFLPRHWWMLGYWMEEIHADNVSSAISVGRMAHIFLTCNSTTAHTRYHCTTRHWKKVNTCQRHSLGWHTLMETSQLLHQVKGMSSLLVDDIDKTYLLPLLASSKEMLILLSSTSVNSIWIAATSCVASEKEWGKRGSQQAFSCLALMASTTRISPSCKTVELYRQGVDPFCDTSANGIANLITVVSIFNLEYIFTLHFAIVHIKIPNTSHS